MSVGEALRQLEASLDGLLIADRVRLSRRMQSLRARGHVDESALAEVEKAIKAGQERVARRAASVPAITYPADLPVSQRKDEILRAIQENQVIVLCGETGSGKTTQLPKICLEAGRGVFGVIGHTQPRRIAARSVAARICEELQTPVGDLVGFKVRFGDETSPRNLVKLMTDGILLAETQSDRMLLQYDTIIIDEAHERSLNIDFMLGYLKTLLPRRPDLKVIVTSATIDPERFARHFANKGKDAPIISVSGRTYPVDVIYRKPGEDDLDERDEQFQKHIVDAVDELSTYGSGDVLVFLSGEREIRETAETLAKHRLADGEHAEVLPLYARLTADEQMRVFKPHDGRRVVLATNVAETSLTVPGIRYVVDPGYARVSRYSPRTKVQRLEIEPISRASADQRKGRCGRLGPGVCIRLYDEQDYLSRDQFTDPEIQRDNLASVILQMAGLKLGRVEEFPFIDAPDARAIKDGYETLHELGAIDDNGQLTQIGRDLAKLPIDPRIGRMILAAGKEGCLHEVLIIASALSIQDPRERPMNMQDAADAAHEEFDDPTSDFLSLLRLWNAWKDRRKHLSGSKLRKWCKEHFVSFVRLREWEDLHAQLGDLANDLHLRVNREPAKSQQVHRALLTGLLCNIAQKTENDRELGNYLGGRSNRYHIFPGSVLFRNGPKWLMASEVVRTTRVYARGVAPVEPEWIEELGAHLLKKSHSDPRWDKHSGRVVANERVTIFGLELVPKRRVHYGAINTSEARDIFIHHALVLGDVEKPWAFLTHNLRLEDDVKALEVRARRQNLLTDFEQRFNFYDARVPHSICTAGAFEKWRHEQSQSKTGPGQRLLYMALEDLVAPGADLPGLDRFPDELDVGSVKLPLSYRLEPGHEADGVTVRVPLEALGQVSAERLAWLVPGHVREKVETILRGLGKEYRRILPAPSQLTDDVMSLLKFGDGNIIDALRLAVSVATTIDVPKDAFAAVPLPLWMSMRIEVVDAEGKTIESGRDVNQLKSLLAPKLRSGMLTSPNRFTREGIKHWDFGDLPERVELDRAGVRFGAFPGIVDCKTSVALRLFDTFDAAEAATRAGTRRLFMFSAVEPLRRHCIYIPGLETAAMLFATMSGGGGGTANKNAKSASFRECVQELIADRAFIGDMLPVRSEKEFVFRTTKGIDRLGPAVQEVVPLVTTIMQFAQDVQRGLAAKQVPAFSSSIDDMRDQFGRLMPQDFMVATPFEWLRHYPRYLQAMRLRMTRLFAGGGASSGVAKDQKLMLEVQPFVKGFEELKLRQKELGLSPVKVAEFGWHVEEYRVQLFAQELKTSVPVSGKRLQELWQVVVRGS
ncbi:MAG: ATP-dependent RNA helicase HrpA [Phycisphaerales bacterium]